MKTWAGRRLGTGRILISCHVITTIGVITIALAGQQMSGMAAMAVVMTGQGLCGLAIMSNSYEMSWTAAASYRR